MKKVDVLLGLQWGDEGKGKVVDVLTPEYDIITRFQGGANAGHTIEIAGDKHILHLIPSGIFHEDTMNIIGNGVIIDPYILLKELEGLYQKNYNPNKNLLISKKAHLILPTHRLLDAVYEKAKGKSKIGSTLKGIGPTYTDKTARNGIRIGEIDFSSFNENYSRLKEYHLKIIKMYEVDPDDYTLDGLTFNDYEDAWFESLNHIRELRFIDSEHYINQSLKENKSILAEGAQGTLLDLDYGTYPFVTSSNTICSGVCSGLGVAPHTIGKVFGIVKAYCTRVGSGPFPTELFGDEGELLRSGGKEFGSTTGRPRRCGWLDLVALKYSIMLNGVTNLVMTKADVLSGFDQLKICNEYMIDGKRTDHFPFEIVNTKIHPVYDEMKGWKSDLTHMDSLQDAPQELINYIKFIEETVGVPFGYVSVGPERSQIMVL